MSIATKRSTFPLHMTPFESYMFADDHVHAPMTFVVQFEFSGSIDREVLQRSLDQALRRHPLLRSLIKPAKSSRDCWLLAEDYDSQITWGSLDDQILVEGAGEFIDLRSEIGVRTWCHHDENKALLTFVFHHAACDGIGAYQFVGDLLWFYGTELGEDYGPLTDLNEQDLRQRLRCSLSPELSQIRDLSRPLEHKPADPVASRSKTISDKPTANPYPRFFTKTYEKDEYRQLRLQAQADSQTVNDRLLEALLCAIGSWNRTHSDAAERKHEFCINMPLDLRDPNQPAFSATNLVTSAFIRRSSDEIQNLEELRNSLRREIAHVKHSRFSSELMKLLLTSPRDPEETHAKYRGEDCYTTAVFSNTGDPTKRFMVELPREKGKLKCANLTLEDINGVSPLRYQTRIAISIFTYRRRLRICLRCDPKYFSDADGEAFLNHFVEWINPA